MGVAIAAAFAALAWSTVGGLSSGQPADPQARTRAIVAALTAALESFRVDNGAFPSRADGLPVLTQGGYFRGPLTDGWGREFRYEAPAGERPTTYVLTSLGPDPKDSRDDIRLEYDRSF